MATTYEFHVNGLAQINVDGVELGITTDGVDIDLKFFTSEVFTDAWGDKIPEDVQNMGQEAMVSCELIKYDVAQLYTAQDRFGNNKVSNTVGAGPNISNMASDETPNLAIGMLLKQCGASHTLTIARLTNVGCETNTEGPWTFQCAYLADSDTFRVGTKVTRHRLTWRCLPNSSGILYTIGST